MTSSAISPFTMPAALASLKGAKWQPNTIASKEQVSWLEKYPRRAEIAASLKEIEAQVTSVFEHHVAFLKNCGWSTDIRQGSDEDMYLASVLSIGGEWVEQGGPYVNDSSGVARVRLSNGPRVDQKRKVAILPTKTPGVTFLIAAYAGASGDRADLEGQASLFAQIYADGPDWPKGEVDFPMVDLKTSATADYMLGIHTVQGDVVSQAVEGFELKMNHEGGVAKAKAEVRLTRGLSDKPVLYIDGPMLVLVMKDGVSEPVFAAFVDQDSWKDPGTLGVE